MRCKSHKRYKGELRPRCSCLDCWIIYIESHLDLGIIDDAIEHQKEFHGGWSIEYGDTDDNLVTNYLFKKKRELELRYE